MNSVLFHAKVVGDLQEARKWYEERRQGLGAEFQSTFEDTLRRIAASPRRFGPIHGDVRYARMARFPYGIFYENIREGVLMVYAVAHHARAPEHWKERL